jgi:ParB family chromosome partitioning protein
VRKLTGQRQIEIKNPAQSPEVTALEQRLREYLGTKVILNQGRKGGTLTIRYYSNEELDALVGKIIGEMDNNSKA